MLKGRPMLCMGVAATITVAVALFTYSDMLWVLVGGAAALLFYSLEKKNVEPIYLAVGVLLGLVATSFLILRQTQAQSMMEKQYNFIGEVYDTQYQQLIKVNLNNGGDWLIRPTSELEGLETGDKLLGVLTITDLTYDTKTYMLSGGILLSADVSNCELLENGKSSFAIWTQQLRDRITMRAMLHNGSVDTTITLALCYSESSYMPQTYLEAFRTCGLSHLLSVSGLHLTILVVCLLTLCKAMGLGNKLQAMVGILSATIIFFAAGMSAGAFRSAVMMSILIAGQCIGKKSDNLNSLGLVAMVSMLLWPTMLADLTYLFSMIITAVILTFTPRLSEPLYLFLIARIGDKHQKLCRLTANVLSMSFAAQLGALSLTAVFFGTMPLLGGLLGILLAPLMYPLLFFGFISGILFLFGLTQLGGVFLALANIFSSFIVSVAERSSQIPFASVAVQYLEDYVALVIVVTCCCILTCLPKNRKRKRIAIGLISLTLIVTSIINLLKPPTNCIGVQTNSKIGITTINSQSTSVIIDAGLNDRSVKYRRSYAVKAPENLVAVIVTNPTAGQKMVNNSANYWGVTEEQILTTKSQEFIHDEITIKVVSDNITVVTVGDKKIVKYWGNYATMNGAVNHTADIIIDREGNLLSKVKGVPVLRWLDGRSSVRI